LVFTNWVRGLLGILDGVGRGAAVVVVVVVISPVF